VTCWNPCEDASMRTFKESEQDEVTSFWRDAVRLPPLPEYLYFVAKGYCIRGMALQRLKCHGEVARNIFLKKDSRIGSLDTILWAGPRYSTHSSEEPGRRFSYSKKSIDLTLEAAVARLHTFAAEFAKQSKFGLEDVARRRADLDKDQKYIEERLAEAEGFALRVSDLSKPSV